MLHERSFRIHRAVHPSDYGQHEKAPRRQGKGRARKTSGKAEALHREKADPRRMNTSYVQGLYRDIARLEGGSRDVLIEPIDITRKDAKIGASSVEERSMSDTENTNAVAEAPKAEKKAVKKRLAKAKVKLIKKTKAKAKPKAKKSGKAKGKVWREQTCINIPVQVKKKLDAKCKQVEKKMNRVINELIAKFLGLKKTA